MERKCPNNGALMAPDAKRGVWVCPLGACATSWNLSDNDVDRYEDSRCATALRPGDEYLEPMSPAEIMEARGETARYGFVTEGGNADNIRKALAIISEYGPIDGGHHKQWVLDQVVRAITAEAGEYPDNPRGYLKWRALQGDWEEGVAP